MSASSVTTHSGLLRRLAVATLALVLGLVVAPVSAQAQEAPVPIMFVGDSITELCTPNFDSFRDDALIALAADDYAVDAVGSLTTSACYPADNEHEGKASDTTALALARLPAGLAATPETPEIAFVLLGTNDVQEDVPVATSAANFNAIIAELRTANPTIHVIVAQIPPYPGKAAHTADLNAAIALLAETGTAPVTIADFHSGIDATHLHTDLIHLNSVGAALLGERAKDAIVATGRVTQPLPEPPTSVVATAGIRSVEVVWEAPVDDGGSPIVDYVVEIYTDDPTPAATVVVPVAADRVASFDDLAIDEYTAAVFARTAHGSSVAAFSAPVTPTRAWGPFDTEQAFLVQQYADFLDRSPDAGGLAYWQGLTNDDQSNVPAIIESFMQSAEFGPRRSIARLYLAFFERAPDQGGFDYWASQIGSGQSNLDDISQAFVGSPEFVTTYGSLTDAQFVDLVYRNVLDRTPDQAGYDFWLGQMASGMTRGQVMTRFSESPEFIGKTKPNVDVIVTYRGMLDREPDQSGYDFWVATIGSDPNSLATLIDNFYRSAEYAARVAAD